MLSVSYIKEHLALHVIVITLYGLMQFLLILTLGEIVYENGYDKVPVNESTYSFRLYSDDRTSIDPLIDSIKDCSDICVACEGDGYTLVSFATGISSDRTGGATVSEISTDEIRYNNTQGLVTLSGEMYDPIKNTVVINGKEFRCGGELNIQIRLPSDEELIFYVDYDSFWEISDQDSIVLSVLYDRRLSDWELSDLEQKVTSSGIIAALYSPEYEPVINKMLSSGEVRLSYMVLFLACLCSGGILVMLIENRRDEYRVMRLCGASRFRITVFRLEYILLILSISSVAGLGMYQIVRGSTSGLIMHTDHSLLIYGMSITGFILISLVSAFILLFLKEHNNED